MHGEKDEINLSKHLPHGFCLCHILERIGRKKLSFKKIFTHLELLAKKLLVHNISFYLKGDCVTFTIGAPGEALPVLVSAPPLRESVAVGELPAELLLLVVGEEEAVVGVVPAQVQAALEVLGGDLGHDQGSKDFFGWKCCILRREFYIVIHPVHSPSA